MDLEAIERIKRLKYRYFRCLDTKDWDGFRGCFVPDATARYGDRLAFDGRDAITQYMVDNVGPTMITLHHGHHPEIDVERDTATGIWALEDTVIMTEWRQLLYGASFYEDAYVRGDDGEWRIAATSYVRTFESIQSLDDTPSWRLLANRWSDPAETEGEAAAEAAGRAGITPT